MVPVIDAMRQILLTTEEQRLLAQFAIDTRFPLPANVEERDLAPARPSPEDFLHPKRDQDRGQSLWTTYNVIQEWMMVGGIRLRDGRRTRPIGGIDQGLQLNSALWMEAQRLLRAVRVEGGSGRPAELLRGGVHAGRRHLRLQVGAVHRPGERQGRALRQLTARRHF